MGRSASSWAPRPRAGGMAALQSAAPMHSPAWPGPSEDRDSALRKQRFAIQTFVRGVFSASGTEAQRLLVSGGQGTGKTSTMLKVLAEIKAADTEVVWALVPTLAKAEELQRDYDGYVRAIGNTSALRSVIIRGRTSPDPQVAGKSMCWRPDAANAVARVGLSVRQTLCRSKCSVCPLAANCGSERQKAEVEAAEKAGEPLLIIMAHEFAYTRSGVPRPKLVIVDEDIVSKAERPFPVGLDRLDRVRDSDPDAEWQTLDTVAKVRDALRLTADEQALGFQPRGLKHMREAGLTPAALSRAAFCLDADTTPALELRPDMDEKAILEILQGYQRSDTWKIVRLLHVLARELKQPRDTLNAVTIELSARVQGVHGQGTQTQTLVHIHDHREVVWAPTIEGASDTVSVLLLDGTASAKRAARLFGALGHIHAPIERNAEVIQVTGKEFSRQSITGKRANGLPLSAQRMDEATRLREQIGAYLRTLAPKAIFVAASMGAKEALQADGALNRMLAGHFGALRGLNTWEHCETAVVIGRDQPSAQEVEKLARCWAADDPEPLVSMGTYVQQSRCRRMRDGSASWEVVWVHPDPRCQEILEAIREAEIVQAIDRVRPVFQARSIILLTSIVVDVTVDRVFTWADLRKGGCRLTRAFGRFGVVPEHSGELARCFPDLWPSKNAAKCSGRGEGGVAAQIRNLFGQRPHLRVRYQRAGRGQQPCTAFVDAAAAQDLGERLRLVLGNIVAYEIIAEAPATTAEEPPISTEDRAGKPTAVPAAGDTRERLRLGRFMPAVHSGLGARQPAVLHHRLE